MKKSFLVATLLITLTIAATPARAGDNSFWGTGIGAALGGWAGSGIGKGDGRLAATGAGVFLGGLIGNSVGGSMDRADAAYYRGGSYSAAPTYYQSYQPYEQTYVAPAPAPQVVYYEQPDVVQYYTPRQSAVYTEGSYMGVDNGYSSPRNRNHHRRNQHCREFTQAVRIDGRTSESYGTACLRPDGSWQIQQ